MKLNEIAVDRYAGLTPLEKLQRLRDDTIISWTGNASDNADGSIDIAGDFTVNSYVFLKKFPIKLGKVRGYLKVTGTSIRDFENFPDSIGGDFNVSHNKIQSLDFIPGDIVGDIDVSYNQLKTLRGIQTYVHDLDCSHNNITTLKGGPEQITGNMICDNNLITNFDGCPESIGEIFSLKHNPIDSLVGIKDKIKECGQLWCGDPTHHISEGGIELLYIEGLYKIDIYPKEFNNVMKKFLDPDGSSFIAQEELFECQNALIEAGLEEYTKL